MRATSGQEDKINIKKRDTLRRNRSHRRGKLNIVGIGPGDELQMSLRAQAAIRDSDCIAGYSTYIKLLCKMTAGKEVISTGMTREIERARKAIECALEGKTVSVISSGDPGVYGMAGVVLELLDEHEAKSIDIEIIPGIISATACASLLGAPLSNDFAAISLSDLLTEWKAIEKRLIFASRSDFVIVLYNPKSKSRTRPLQRAWSIIRRYRSADTPVGVVRNAYRSLESVRVLPLKDAARLKDIDMTTTIIVGNSKTYVKDGYMITPRGYRTEASSGKIVR